jgi:hypothetical protein
MYQCFFVTTSSGLRSGGGIGDAVKGIAIAVEEELYFGRWFYDLTFFAFVVVILLNGGMCCVTR